MPAVALQYIKSQTKNIIYAIDNNLLKYCNLILTINKNCSFKEEANQHTVLLRKWLFYC